MGYKALYSLQNFSMQFIKIICAIYLPPTRFLNLILRVYLWQNEIDYKSIATLQLLTRAFSKLSRR